MTAYCTRVHFIVFLVCDACKQSPKLATLILDYVVCKQSPKLATLIAALLLFACTRVHFIVFLVCVACPAFKIVSLTCLRAHLNTTYFTMFLDTSLVQVLLPRFIM